MVQSDVEWKDVLPVGGHQVGGFREASKDWRSIYLYVMSAVIFGILFVAIVNLQVVQGQDYAERSEMNRLEEHLIQPDRGVIYDRNGEKLAINIPSFNVVLDPREVEDKEDLSLYWETLAGVLTVTVEEFTEKYGEAIDADPMTKRVVLAQDVNRDQVLDIRSRADEMPGVWIDYSSKRDYVCGETFAHILGYTSEADDIYIEETEDVDMGDIVGRDGVELYYDDRFRGTKGVRIVEIDAMQNVVAEYVNQGSAPVAGDSLYLTIDADSQRKLYEIMVAGVAEYEAEAGAAIIEDVNTGEIIAAVNVPTFDNNLFIGGIDQENYSALVNNPGKPLFNRFAAAQEPPGSMYKTLVAAAALQDGTITRDTVIQSTGFLYWDDGTTYCREYHGHVYGSLNLIGGLAKSSNNYFCTVMLREGIDNFVPYAESFNFGTQTGLDIPGEATGRVPSPENKAELAEVSPWLDEYWYPGDTANSGIGQGITTVTPIQMVNWAASVANGGKVLQPRFAYKWLSDPSASEIDESGEASVLIDGAIAVDDVVAESDDSSEEKMVETTIVREGEVDAAHMATIAEGMRNSVSGSQRIIIPLGGAKAAVAAKTGTAEYGVKDEDGFYTKTHAWVMGFWPYENPKYSFIFFLQGGGESNNSAELARQFVDWEVGTEGN